jgi:hypothetical protein
MRSLSAFKPFGAKALRFLVVVWLVVDGACPCVGQEAGNALSYRANQASSNSISGLQDQSGDLPDEPEPQYSLDVQPFAFHAAMAANEQNRPWEVTPAGTLQQEPFSRIGVSASVSSLGVGANASIVLTEYFDGRIGGNYFALNYGRFETDGVNVYAGLHLASGTVAMDAYPFNGPIRLSAGLMFYNINHVSGTLRVAPGTGFTLNGESFYAGSAGTTPLTGVAEVAFHAIRPAPTLTFGFGKFIPRSNRHWSLPSEYGVAFAGAPTMNVNLAGTVCSDPKLTMCSQVSDTSNPVGAEFNGALQAKLADWRRSLGRVQIFPIISGGVSYSFNTPWESAPKAKF